jgi:hypothetical protein
MNVQEREHTLRHVGSLQDIGALGDFGALQDAGIVTQALISSGLLPLREQHERGAEWAG